MNGQELAVTLAPWIVIVTAIFGWAGAMLRARGVGRLRDNMARDVDLHATLPAGAAKEAIEEALDYQARSLRDRVVHGLRPNRLQLLAIVALMVLGLSLLMRMAHVIEQRWPDDDGLSMPGWYVAGMKYFSLFGMALALFALGYVVMALFWKWIGEKSVHAFESPTRKPDEGGS